MVWVLWMLRFIQKKTDHDAIGSVGGDRGGGTLMLHRRSPNGDSRFGCTEAKDELKKTYIAQRFMRKQQACLAETLSMFGNGPKSTSTLLKRMVSGPQKKISLRRIRFVWTSFRFLRASFLVAIHSVCSCSNRRGHQCPRNAKRT